MALLRKHLFYHFFYQLFDDVPILDNVHIR